MTNERGKVLITGATGFVGTALSSLVESQGMALRRAVRSPAQVVGDSAVIGDLGPQTDWSRALDGISTVVHLAARVHVMHETDRDPLTAFRKVNTEATRQLATSAARAGVKRFVFVSSIKVNGDETREQPYTETDTPDLSSPYGVSKYEAEQLLLGLHQPGHFEVVIVRPTLVYGPGVGGNFLQLLKLVDRGVPLPFGATRNLRSLVSVANLSDFLLTCAQHPAAAGQVFLVSDGADLSTTELVQKLGHHLGHSSLLLPFPRWSVDFPARLLGKEAIVMRLWGSLQVDISKARRLLGWSPKLSVDEALAAVVSWYKSTSSKK